MGLLITTSLIMVNTYGNVDKSSPPQESIEAGYDPSTF
jgi:hypothetical protein